MQLEAWIYKWHFKMIPNFSLFSPYKIEFCYQEILSEILKFIFWLFQHFLLLFLLFFIFPKHSLEECFVYQTDFYYKILLSKCEIFLQYRTIFKGINYKIKSPEIWGRFSYDYFFFFVQVIAEIFEKQLKKIHNFEKHIKTLTVETCFNFQFFTFLFLE